MERSAYVAAARVVPWLVADIEASLGRCSDGDLIDERFLQDSASTRLPSDEQVALVTRGLKAVGVLRESTRGVEFQKTGMQDTAGYRQGVRDTVAAGERERSCRDDISLCAAVPNRAPDNIRECATIEASDLRSGIVGLISATNRRLVLASPFWDADTAADIADIVRRRIECGVTVDVLSRGDSSNGVYRLRKAIGNTSALRIFRWYENQGAGQGVTTFHFKAVVADDGHRAYLGSANLTRGGLRATMELGLIVKGDIGRRVARIVDSVLAASERYEPNE
ncbi:MAG TPA: phospholipase D-like domain-containing protein [Vicinamibacterales bacterium]